MHEVSSTPAQVAEWLQQSLNTPDEPRALSEVYSAAYERWHELEERGELTEEHRAVLARCEQRMRELIEQKLMSVDQLLASGDRIRGGTRMAAAPTKGGGAYQNAGATGGDYLQTGGPAPEVKGAYLSETKVSGGDYLTTTSKEGAYLATPQLKAHTDALTQFGAHQRNATKALAVIQKRHVITQRVLVAKHGAAADVSRHIMATHVRRLRMQQIALAAQAKTLVAALPSAYLQADAKQPAVDMASVNAAMADLERRLQAHTQAIVEIQRALQLSEAMRKK